MTEMFNPPPIVGAFLILLANSVLGDDAYYSPLKKGARGLYRIYEQPIKLQ
jgi:hypothetical protein